MISETLLRALQERMRKLTDASSAYAAQDAELRASLERAKLNDAAEPAQEAAAVEESRQLTEQIHALRDHVNDLIHNNADAVLVAGLKEEVSELESKREGVEQRLEELRSRRHQALDHAMRKLESAEQRRRHIVQEAMLLRVHIEKLVHG